MSEENPVTMGQALGHLFVSLASWGVSISVSYVMIRVITQPDFGRTLVMRGAQGGERYCMRQAQLWASRADKFSRTYNTARQITL